MSSSSYPNFFRNKWRSRSFKRVSIGLPLSAFTLAKPYLYCSRAISFMSASSSTLTYLTKCFTGLPSLRALVFRGSLTTPHARRSCLLFCNRVVRKPRRGSMFACRHCLILGSRSCYFFRCLLQTSCQNLVCEALSFLCGHVLILKRIQN